MARQSCFRLSCCRNFRFTVSCTTMGNPCSFVLAENFFCRDVIDLSLNTITRDENYKEIRRRKKANHYFPIVTYYSDTFARAAKSDGRALSKNCESREANENRIPFSDRSNAIFRIKKTERKNNTICSLCEEWLPRHRRYGTTVGVLLKTKKKKPKKSKNKKSSPPGAVGFSSRPAPDDFSFTDRREIHFRIVSRRGPNPVIVIVHGFVVREIFVPKTIATRRREISLSLSFFHRRSDPHKACNKPGTVVQPFRENDDESSHSKCPQRRRDRFFSRALRDVIGVAKLLYDDVT